MSRKRENNRGGDTGNTGAWMITFSDLIMLMLTFFVLLLSMSSLNQKTLKEVFSHLQESTGVLEFSGYGEIQSMSDFVEKYTAAESKIVIEENIILKMFLPDAELAQKMRNDFKDIEKMLAVSEDERGLILTFQENILFDAGSADIKEDSRPFLDTVVDTISACPNQVMIMGHTDNTPTRSGSYNSNWELSVYRGNAVLEYFLARNLSPGRFSVGGYGSVHPLYPNSDVKKRDLNRRVEIIFKHLQEL